MRQVRTRGYELVARGSASSNTPPFRVERAESAEVLRARALAQPSSFSKTAPIAVKPGPNPSATTRVPPRTR